MAEIVEYVLAVMASTLLLTGSVFVYNSFASYESALQLRGAFSAVAQVVDGALVNGRATSALPLPESTIGCEESTFYVSVGAGAISQAIPAQCDFQARISAGTHLVSFTTVSGQLNITVS